MIAWRVRNNLNLDMLAAAGAGGVSGDAARPDNIIYPGGGAVTPNTFEHPTCLNTGDQTALPAAQ